jgi:hypothetical protein
LAQDLVADSDLLPPGQLLSSEGGSEIMPLRLLQNLDSLSLHSSRNLPIGGSSAQSMHHCGVTSSLHPLQQLAHPAVAHSHPLGRLALADQFVLARFSHSSLSRSSWLIAIRSILLPYGCQEELSTLAD